MFMKVYRCVHDRTDGHHISDECVLKDLGVMPPLVVLRLARVLLAVRVASRAPPFVSRLLCRAAAAPSSWLCALAADLEIFSRACAGDPALAHRPLDQWWSLFRAGPHATGSVLLALQRPRPCPVRACGPGHAPKESSQRSTGAASAAWRSGPGKLSRFTRTTSTGDGVR